MSSPVRLFLGRVRCVNRPHHGDRAHPRTRSASTSGIDDHRRHDITAHRGPSGLRRHVRQRGHDRSRIRPVHRPHVRQRRCRRRRTRPRRRHHICQCELLGRAAHTARELRLHRHEPDPPAHGTVHRVPGRQTSRDLAAPVRVLHPRATGRRRQRGRFGQQPGRRRIRARRLGTPRLRLRQLADRLHADHRERRQHHSEPRSDPLRQDLRRAGGGDRNRPELPPRVHPRRRHRAGPDRDEPDDHRSPPGRVRVPVVHVDARRRHDQPHAGDRSPRQLPGQRARPPVHREHPRHSGGRRRVARHVVLHPARRRCSRRHPRPERRR